METKKSISPYRGTYSQRSKILMSDSFGIFQYIRCKRGNIYIKVIKNKQDNCGKHYKGRDTKLISPADYIHKMAHKG
jgi:hypothetical protein